MKDRGKCRIRNCKNRAWARKLCSKHISKMRRAGTYKVIRPRK